MSFENVYILVIDDNPSDADVLRNLFDMMGINYDVVFDNRDILPALEEVDIPDVIFLDLEIPGTTGYKVLETIRSVADFDNVPVVAYSAHSSEMPHAREAGFTSFLGKPLRAKDFQQHIEAILGGEGVWEVRE